MTSEELIAHADITYRQLDHWTRKGYLSLEAPGSGHRRDYPATEVLIVVRMQRLIKLGLTVEQAAESARDGLPGVAQLVKDLVEAMA